MAADLTPDTKEDLNAATAASLDTQNSKSADTQPASGNWLAKLWRKLSWPMTEEQKAEIEEDRHLFF